MPHRIVLSAAILLALAGFGSAATREELLIQTQAADVLGGALTDAVTQATGEIDAARKLKSTTAPVVQPATGRKHITYRELFDQTAAKIKKGGNAAIDPTLANMPAGQMFDEMTSLQQYNIAQYLRLIRMLDTIQSSRLPTTMPALDTLGQSTSNNLNWRKQRQELRNAVVARIVNGSNSRRDQAIQSNLNAPSYYGGSGGGAGGAGGAGGVTTTNDDPRWQPYFYGAFDGMNGWNDDAVYSDPFAFRGGGGIYRRDDTRVNRDYDPRTSGQYDRRVNIESDRRLNIHVDPRENF
jgi:hypothetical protein